MAATGALRTNMVQQLEDEQWQIFTELDLQSETEQIRLAGFLDSLIRTFQDDVDEKKSDSVQALEADDEADDERKAAESVPAPVSGASAPRLTVNRGASLVGIKQEDLVDYGPLPKGPLSQATATAIIEVYRRGGKLSIKAVKKVLRDAYKVRESAARPSG
jgi:hypothetical protein